MVEAFGPGAIVVQETPALLGEVDIQGLIKDLADDLAEYDEALDLKVGLPRWHPQWHATAVSAPAAD